MEVNTGEPDRECTFGCSMKGGERALGLITLLSLKMGTATVTNCLFPVHQMNQKGKNV